MDTPIEPRVAGQAGNPQLEQWWTVPFSIAAAGSYEIRFAATKVGATPAAGDYLYLDQVTLLNVPAALVNASFEGSGGWTLSGGASVGSSGSNVAGISGSGLLSLRAAGASSAGTATTASAVTLAAGTYSLSARVATAAGGVGCATTLGYLSAGSFVALAELPAPTALGFFETYTTASFTLAAGSYSLRLAESCVGSYQPVQLDALSLNYAGPNIGNAGFEVPDLGLPLDSLGRPQKKQPSGASWTFGSATAIYGNGGSLVSDRPRTSSGKQYSRGNGTGSGSSISQALTLEAGSYVLIARASDGIFKLSVNGIEQPYTLFGPTLLHPAGGTAFAEVQSDPFTVATGGSVTLALTGADLLAYHLDQVRILRLSAPAPVNPPPAVTLALTVNNSPAQATAWAGSTLQASASASDGDGVKRLRVLRNGVALAPESTATAPASAPPLSVTVSPLTVGAQTFTAEATDHLGAISSASQSLTVLAAETLLNGGFETPSQVGVVNGFTQNPSGADWTFVGRASIQRNGSAWVAPNAPEGFQTAALQCGVGMTAGTIWQDIGFSAAKTIQITLRWATRTYNGQTLVQPIQLRVGGVNQALFASTASAGFTQYTSPPISVGAGSQRIEMSATQCDADRTTFIDQVQLSAINAPPGVSSFSVTPTAVQPLATALSLAATASDPDAAGYVASIDYEYKRSTDASFSPIAGQSCANSAASPTRPFSCAGKSWTPPGPGSYVLRAKATDDGAAVGYSTQQTIAVCGPTVALTAPANGASFGVTTGGQATITLTATVGQQSTDAACGSLTQVQFFLNGSPIPGATVVPTAGTNTYSYTGQYPASTSAYTFSAQVVEAGVRTANSASANVTVAVNSPPQIMGIAPVSPLIVGQTGTLRATASDPGGAVNTIQVTAQLTTGGTVYSQTCSNATSCDLALGSVAAGLYQVSVVATDNQGAQSTTNTLIAASEAPNVPALALPGTVGIGATAGQFAVSESGAATFSIPISVSPGVNGLQPNLAFVYNSQGGEGNLGVGWNLSGTSSITRCPKTIATDGVREPVNYDNITDPFSGNDAFCLDGQRLVPVSGGLTQVSCPNISGVIASGLCKAWEFRTELDNYSRIIAISDNADATGVSSGSGPTRFRVYTKSGQILEYGSRWWGIGAPRPDPQTSLISNAGF
ncbi:MAG TPA: SpvB/TcaC N-terminal domain-containing protein, partial [Burkholderiaceae bacterium]|nr:SpvB/TcaC N-terminal domain-containing protein [Burkholderiaceae bacterium]